mgnify:CR=1 FL=1
MKAGIFQKHGIVLETFGTQGAGETLQAVIAGSRRYRDRHRNRGRHARVCARRAGTCDRSCLPWASAINIGTCPPTPRSRALADATEKNTLSYSTNGVHVARHQRLASSSSSA